MKHGFFITFEGGEGSGKTTQIRRVASWLENGGYSVLVTREPGGTPFADRIRKILLAPNNKGMDPVVELLLYEVARRDHVERRIIPHLKKGGVVLCDRFFDATTAYQGYARKLMLPLVLKLNELAAGPIRPDLTFIFDLPVACGLERVRRRSGKMNRLDREKRRFHERVRRGYLTLARKEKKRFRVIDTRKPQDEVFRSIQRETQKCLSKIPC